MKLLYPFAKRFIAGHDFESAKPVIKELMQDGYEVSIDYLGELSKTKEHCEEAKDQYIQIIKHFRHDKIDISIKPSQLGLLISPSICLQHLEKIAVCAKVCSHTIRLDMEDSKVTEHTKKMAIFLNKEFGNIGVAIQANLLRTEKDLSDLISNNVSVRLVKGAYKENEIIAHQDKFEIGGCFFAHAARLYSEKANKPAIATHDEELLEDIEELIPNPETFDYEFLYGIRRDLQKDFKDKDYKVRIYVPFGTDWLPYTMRRLKEWKNLKFVIYNIFREWFK